MRLIIHAFYTTPLHIAVKKGNLPLIRLLLSNKEIDLNAQDGIFIFAFLMKFQLYLNDFSFIFEERLES